MKNVRYLSPNRRTHLAFGMAMEYAEKHGVKLLAFDCCVSPDEIWLDQPIKIVL